MEPSSFTPEAFSPREGEILLEVARAAIAAGLVPEGEPAPGRLPGPPGSAGAIPGEVMASLPPRLLEPGACFVTLERGSELRGCMGSLEARRPLARDVALNAWAAAFRDPRFPPVTTGEFPLLSLRISVLGPATPLSVGSEEELLRTLRPGVDGVILELGNGRRSTFLPQVWEKLPQPGVFVAHLKEKAGLPRDFWSPSLVWSTYAMVEIRQPRI